MTLLTVVVIATALAVYPSDGAAEITTVGVEVYPDPSLLRIISLIHPVPILAVAVAVIPSPTKLIVEIYPSSPTVSSTSLILVLMRLIIL